MWGWYVIYGAGIKFTPPDLGKTLACSLTLLLRQHCACRMSETFNTHEVLWQGDMFVHIVYYM